MRLTILGRGSSQGWPGCSAVVNSVSKLAHRGEKTSAPDLGHCWGKSIKSISLQTPSPKPSAKTWIGLNSSTSFSPMPTVIISTRRR